MTAQRPYLLPITAHSDRAGKMMAEKVVNYLEADPEIAIADAAYTLSTRRTMHEMRSFALGATVEQLKKSIETPPAGVEWTQRSTTPPRLGFVFTGQGAQWFAMGRQLLEQSPLFKQSLERCDKTLQALPDLPDWSVITELLRSKEETRLSETRFSQPLCTALQLALVDLLAQWDITPSAVVGHSSGEMAAAYAAGILSFENAIVAAYYRGLYMGSGVQNADSVPGAMMAVGMTENEVAAELEPYVGRITVAAMNSPSSFTVSGDADAVEELRAKLTERKVFARKLQVTQGIWYRY